MNFYQSMKSAKCELNIFQKIVIQEPLNETTHVAISTDYGRPVRKSTSLHVLESTPTPKFLGTAETYFVCHIGPNYQISLIYAFIGCL